MKSVKIINDFVANGYGLLTLNDDNHNDLAVLQVNERT